MKKPIYFRILFYTLGPPYACARTDAEHKNGTGSFPHYLGGIQYFGNL